MPALTEKELSYGVEGNLNIDQKFKESTSKIIDMMISKLISRNRLERSIIRSLFCSLCNQFLLISSMASHLLSKDRFAKVIRKTFFLHLL